MDVDKEDIGAVLMHVLKSVIISNPVQEVGQKAPFVAWFEKPDSFHVYACM